MLPGSGVRLTALPGWPPPCPHDPGQPGGQAQEDPLERKQCRPCEITWAALGLLAGAAVIYVALDVIFDFGLPQWAGRVPRLATVTDLHDGEVGDVS